MKNLLSVSLFCFSIISFAFDLNARTADSVSIKVNDLKSAGSSALKASAINELSTQKINSRLESASVTQADLLVLQDPGAKLNENSWKVSASVLLQKMKPLGVFKSKTDLVFNFDSLDSTPMPAIELGVGRNIKFKNYPFKISASAQAAYAVQSTQTYFKTGLLVDNSRLIMQSGTAGLNLLLSNPWLNKVELELGCGQGNFNYSHQAKQDYASFSEDLKYTFTSLGLVYSVTNSWGAFLRLENKDQTSSSSLAIQQQTQSLGTRFIW